MSLLLYLAVLAVSVTSVLLGFDWLTTPPPRPVKHVQVARTTAPIIPAAPKPVRTVAVPPPAVPLPATQPDPKPAAVAPAQAPAPQLPAVAETPAVMAAPAEPAAPVATPPAAAEVSPATDAQAAAPTESAAPTETAAPAPRCDIQACTRAYTSFRASDCTWQPYDGPRRFCDKGTPPPAAATAGSSVEPQARAPACNVQACSRAYLSFDPTDCTWQPYDGPRQLCEK